MDLAKQLALYIKIVEDRAEVCSKEIERFADLGDYMKANGFKVTKATHEQCLIELKRILEGKVAIEETFDPKELERVKKKK